jgi:hypothetical protein
MTGAMVATGILFFPAAPLFLFMHGKDITIPKGHEITVYTNTDFDLSKSKGIGLANAAVGAPITAGAPLESKPASGTPLTNADVLKLKGVGLGDQVIIDKIKASRAEYRLDVNDIVELKQAGLSDAVISAMVQASQR